MLEVELGEEGCGSMLANALLPTGETELDRSIAAAWPANLA